MAPGRGGGSGVVGARGVAGCAGSPTRVSSGRGGPRAQGGAADPRIGVDEKVFGRSSIPPDAKPDWSDPWLTRECGADCPCCAQFCAHPVTKSAVDLTLHDLEEALGADNGNFGAGYIESRGAVHGSRPRTAGQRKRYPQRGDFHTQRRHPIHAHDVASVTSVRCRGRARSPATAAEKRSRA